MSGNSGSSEIDSMAARMFFNVSVQSAFALEDPNSRFGIEFQNAQAHDAGNAATIDSVAHRIYETDIEGGKITFETNPPNVPGLSRVIVRGGGTVAIIDAVLNGLKSAEYFTTVEQKPLDQVANTAENNSVGNRVVRLVISDRVEADHDVAALFSWGASSDKVIILEMMAWPINKSAEL